ncbi:MAG TPA: sugar transferase [Gemmatimonadales bacterium]|nr:sugar transferase [Gemmatimonadales bacterium]
MTSLRINDLLLQWREQSVTYGMSRVRRYEDSARRALNVVVASVGLVISAPLMLVVAALVKLTSKGPVFYQQTRVGLDRRAPDSDRGNHRRVADLGGKPFTIYKFRTMKARDDGRQVWAAPGDARITRIGRVLRQFRLDELPQLVNVLKGDMNVVGPRPEQPRIFADLRTQVHRYTERQRVRPGITGWAQINHHYDESIEDVRRKVAYDLDYISRQSLSQDLKIMLLTAPAMVLRKGAW